MTVQAEGALTIEAGERPIRAINEEIRTAVEQGRHISVLDPRSRHNLAVALTGGGTVTFEGSVGYYCGGLSAGGNVVINGNTGWGAGEGLAAGTVTINGNAGMSAGAAMRGGTVHVRGDAGPRCGIAQKGGQIVVEGDVGYLTGFMGHGGRVISLGDAIGSVGESLWEGSVWVAKEVKSLGVDTKIVEPDAVEVAEVEALLDDLGVERNNPDWKKIVSAQKLWYFEARDAQKWLMI